MTILISTPVVKTIVQPVIFHLAEADATNILSSLISQLNAAGYTTPTLQQGVAIAGLSASINADGSAGVQVTYSYTAPV